MFVFVYMVFEDLLIVDAMQGSNVGRLLVTSSALLFPATGLFVGALRWLVQG